MPARKHAACCPSSADFFASLVFFFACGDGDDEQHVQGPAGRASAALLQLIQEYLVVERSFAGAVLLYAVDRCACLLVYDNNNARPLFPTCTPLFDFSPHGRLFEDCRSVALVAELREEVCKYDRCGGLL